jgi:ribosomal-protein-alanine N-acetyltransferase
MNCYIESLNSNNIDGVYEVELSAFSHPWSKQAFLDELANPHARYFVLKSGDEVIGYAGLWHIIDEGHITNIAVKHTERGKGIGKFLLATLISKAREVGVEHMTLEVNVNNAPAIHLYESYGFKGAGIRKKYYNNRDDALIMWLDV